MPDLIRLVHGNVSGLAKLRDLFRRQWTAKCLGKNNLAEVTDVELEKCPVSKRQLERKIQSIAVKEKRGVFDKVRWYVHSCVLSKYGMDNLSVTETMADMSNDGRKSPCQSSTALGMPTIKQFVQPASPLARQASPPSIGTNKGSLNSIDSSLQNGILNAPSMASTRPTIHGPSTKIQSKQSIVARNILGKNLGNKNLPAAVLSKPTVIVLDDDDGSGGGNEQNSTHIAVLQETYPEINGITSPPVKKRSLCFSEQKDGKLESEVRQETVPMEIDE